MSQTYKAVGINLKSMPLGENDRLLTILTKEHGLLRVVAQGARKHKSSLSGRSALFVVNELLLAKGKSLDRIIQAETLVSHSGLSGNLAKLTAGQYLAELVLLQAMSEQPQEELFALLSEHLRRLERSPHLGSDQSGVPLLAMLAQATFHFLALAGLAPQVQACCVSRQTIVPEPDREDWLVGFSIPAGGTVDLAITAQLKALQFQKIKLYKAKINVHPNQSSGQFSGRVAETSAQPYGEPLPEPMPDAIVKLTARQLALFQELAQPHLTWLTDSNGSIVGMTDRSDHGSLADWQLVERTLRYYVQYHFERRIRSADLLQSCLLS